MVAEHPIKRKRTAREVAAQLGVSERTVRKFVAQPRDEYLAEAAERRVRIRAMRAEGLSMRKIAAKEGVTVGAVHWALNRPEDEAA